MVGSSEQTDTSHHPGTIAAFSPANIAGSSLASRQRSTVIVHRKSPLLVATPPPVTRALAYSHPYLVPISRVLSLLTWTSQNAWESYLLVASFWGLVLHGDFLVLWAGPLVVICGLIMALNTTAKHNSRTKAQTEKDSKEKKKRQMGSVHHKSLDEIVDTLRDFTTKCNILLEPLLEMMDFIAAQQEATANTARPAVTMLLTRILYITPLWVVLSLPPFYIITTQRVVLVVGTIILTWHSKPARIFRVMLWRSVAIRQICSLATGLNFIDLGDSTDLVPSYIPRPTEPSISFAMRKTPLSPGVRFTFILYENQRRWLGLGWTTTLFSYERAPWTDEHLNPAPAKDEFELPDVKSDHARWRWVPGSEWTVEVEQPKKSKGGKGKNGPELRTDTEGWTYYDNKWHDCRGGEDGWTRYTRRRKWCRDAELVEVISEEDDDDESGESREDTHGVKGTNKTTPSSYDGTAADSYLKQQANDNEVKHRKKRWFSGGGGNSNDRGHEDTPSAASSSSMNEKQRHSNSNSKSHESNLTAAFSAAKSDIKDKHEKHKAELRDLQSKATASKNNFLHGHSPRKGDHYRYHSNSDGRSSTHSLRSRPSMDGTRSVNGGLRVGLRSSRSNLGGDGDTGSPARSLRDQELELERDVPDQWGPHTASSAASIQRVQSQWGLNDEAEMGLG
ncbi:integral peroxisomal membrane protein [Ascosphaera apis ARSEF 7405]|uniref:Integral peroxisomal membrane protein n=1 Tax=Ascosphaera apis ARSEF 7405 TaxID=392613 RepID=A0A168AJ22_9EURO|nr:integral peroxisomal membrane protein [Ascosphaera apis ARSEF 7405]